MIYVSSRAYKEARSECLPPLNRTVVIENGIDQRPYQDGPSSDAIRRSLGVAGETTVISCVARLHEQKGIDILLSALHQLRESNFNARVWVVGDGHLSDTLRRQAADLGLTEVVQFLGFRDDVPEILKSSDIFVLPSRFEAMSIGIMEAMAAGLPCVVTDVGENARMVEHGVNGFVIPPEDPHSLVEALGYLLTDSALLKRMGQASRQKVEEYSDVPMAAQTMNAYASVC